MNSIEHLLTCLAEEPVEITQVATKCLRFGIDDRNMLDPKGPTNRERLVLELNDLIAVANLCAEAGLIPADWQNSVLQTRKRQRVREFMDYARKQGALT